MKYPKYLSWCIKTQRPHWQIPPEEKGLYPRMSPSLLLSQPGSPLSSAPLSIPLGQGAGKWPRGADSRCLLPSPPELGTQGEMQETMHSKIIPRVLQSQRTLVTALISHLGGAALLPCQSTEVVIVTFNRDIHRKSSVP